MRGFLGLLLVVLVMLASVAGCATTGNGGEFNGLLRVLSSTAERCTGAPAPPAVLARYRGEGDDAAPQASAGLLEDAAAVVGTVESVVRALTATVRRCTEAPPVPATAGDDGQAPAVPSGALAPSSGGAAGLRGAGRR